MVPQLNIVQQQPREEIVIPTRLRFEVQDAPVGCPQFEHLVRLNVDARERGAVRVGLDRRGQSDEWTEHGNQSSSNPDWLNVLQLDDVHGVDVDSPIGNRIVLIRVKSDDNDGVTHEDCVAVANFVLRTIAHVEPERFEWLDASLIDYFCGNHWCLLSGVRTTVHLTRTVAVAPMISL